MLRSRGVRLLVVGVAALAGGVLAHAIARAVVPDSGPRVRVLPYPHHVPKTPDGVSLRFAMVQDVLTERFARHGPAYYAERNRLAKAELAASPADDRREALTDDLAAGLARLGETDEAVRLLRNKLASQQARGITGSGLYSTYANLGTFLIHGNVRAAQAGDAAAKERLREGHDFVVKAIEVNPESHFGREKWQAVLVEFLLATIDEPGLLQAFDMIGDRLDADIDPRAGRALRPVNPGDSNVPGLRDAWVSWGHARNFASLTDEPHLPDYLRRDFRGYIAHVGSEGAWAEKTIPSLHPPVAFDEPVLGIIGMWREGGGANPPFALCLGETMLRVGQRYLAWSAFERASRLADDFSPDPDQRQFLRDHCRKRQEMIERQLPGGEVADLRPRFDAELAYGQGYQRDYQQYEAEQIDKGQSIEDEYFHQAFLASRPPIASPVGPEDELVVTSQNDRINDMLPGARAAWGLLGAGVAALAVAIRLRRGAGDLKST